MKRGKSGQADLSDLLVATGRRDRAAFRALFEQTAPRLFGVILAVVRDRGAAEETLQTVYLRVWREASTIDPADTAPMTWMLGLAHSRALDVVRARGEPPGLGGLRTDQAEPVPPHPGILAAIERSIDAPSRKETLDLSPPGHLHARTPPRPEGKPAAEEASSSREASRDPEWDELVGSRNRWRGAALVALLVAAGLGLALARPDLVDKIMPRGGDTFVAVATPAGDAPGLAARVDMRAGTIAIRSLSAKPPTEGSLQVWFVTANGESRSLGLIGRDGRISLSGSWIRRLTATGARIVITQEPTGGSPTGTPSESVLFSGPLVAEPA